MKAPKLIIAEPFPQYIGGQVIADSAYGSTRNHSNIG